MEIPDGGSVLIPVHYRPTTVQSKNRWWVLQVSARIYIEEEERQERLHLLRSILPRWLAEGLTTEGK